MSKSRTAVIPKPKKQPLSVSAGNVPRIGMFAFLAAFAGILAAVPLTIALMMPMVHQQLASDISKLNTASTARFANTSLTLTPDQMSNLTAEDRAAVCGPVTASAAVLPGGVLGASNIVAPSPGSQGQGGSSSGSNPPSKIYIKKLISGNLTSKGVISNTGPGSYNNVESTQTATTKITNNNNLSVANTSNQQASSGEAETEYNTNSGSAVSGTATNSNNTDVNVSVSNN